MIKIKIEFIQITIIIDNSVSLSILLQLIPFLLFIFGMIF